MLFKKKYFDKLFCRKMYAYLSLVFQNQMYTSIESLKLFVYTFLSHLSCESFLCTASFF